MNYLNIKPEPKDVKKLPHSLAIPFENWMLNDGYTSRLQRQDCSAHYTHATKAKVVIDSFGRLNEAGQKRYSVFLQCYFKGGSQMMTKLRAQSVLFKRVA